MVFDPKLKLYYYYYLKIINILQLRYGIDDKIEEIQMESSLYFQGN